MSKFNFFDRVTVSTTAFTWVSWEFNSTGIMLLNESTTSANIIQYSFNGTDLHGDLRPNSPSSSMAFDNRTESSIYFRLAPGAGSAVLRIETWGSR